MFNFFLSEKQGEVDNHIALKHAITKNILKDKFLNSHMKDSIISITFCNIFYETHHLLNFTQPDNDFFTLIFNFYIN